MGYIGLKVFMMELLTNARYSNNNSGIKAEVKAEQNTHSSFNEEMYLAP